MKKFIVIFMAICILNCLAINNFNTVYAYEEDGTSNIVIELNSMQTLSEENADKKLPIASIVKLMTLYLTFNALDAGVLNENDDILISEYSASHGGSQLFLDANTKHKLCDLIKSVVIASANDSSVAIAETLCGSEAEFVNKMNITAKELGMTLTNYVDSTGLDDNGYSSARDVSIIASKVLTSPHYLKYSKIWLDEYTHPSGRKTELANTNKLLKTYSNCLAGKTGTTENAGYCFASYSEKNGLKLISVVLNSDNTKKRFEKTIELLNLTFAKYEYVSLYEKNQKLDFVNFLDEFDDKVDIITCTEVGYVKEKSKSKDIEIKITEIKTKRPIKKGEVVGTLDVYDNDKLINSFNLTVNKDINSLTIFEVIKGLMTKW